MAVAQRVDRLSAGIALVVLGLLLCVVFAVTAGREPHSYVGSASAPSTARLTSGGTYGLSVHGGVATETALGLDPAQLSCSITAAGRAAQRLTLVAAQSDTKATNQIATFVAPFSGTVSITCSGVPAVFVDDADDAGFDHAGLTLLLGVLALTIGAPLALSGLRERSMRRADLPGTGSEFGTASGAAPDTDEAQPVG